jgi:sterol desaturase/sphingolipid hydroxylase (fatty acid hydroxylase superfamily)
MTGSLQHFAMQVASLLVWLVALTVVFVPLERVFALRQRKDRLKDVPRDLGFYFLNSLLPAFLIGIPISILVAGLQRVTPEAYTDAVDGLPLAVKIFLGLVVSEIGSYWGHRWSHQTPFLWRFHSLHHAPEHIDWLVNTRAHPLDMVFTRLCGLVPLYVLGLAQGSGLVPTLVLFFGTVWAFFVHANIRWRFGPLEQLIATPHFHHWHHTNDENRDHNYAALFPWVDRIFGTYHGPKHWPPVYGVDEPPPADFTGALLHPFAPPRRPVQPAAEATKDA